MKRTWTNEQESLLRIEYSMASRNRLTELFPDKTLCAIKGKAKKMRLFRRDSSWKFWVEEKRTELINMYPDMTNSELAKYFNTTESAINAIAFKLRLFKSKEFHKIHSSKGYFKKGQIPVNKGKKQTEFMSRQAIERTRATRFKKGHMPANSVPVGYERIDKDGYIYIKTQENRKLVLKHRYIWEQNNGAIPKGYNIQFRDGNKHNCSIENLYIISRADQLKQENSLHARYPKEVQLLIQLKGALNRQINNAINKNQDGTD
ncbi:MAG: HNH endonuclease signature motif containing protein [Dysgonomonas sp.]|uniref:HNH endonuclease signature motif containing protein n=1 Tax=Dysgonomonas sp. TaxID=1891233 RepID=UPI003A8C7362